MSLEPSFGIDFSPRRAAELGLDPSETFLALLIHLKARLVRLPLRWDDIAPEPGRYALEGVRWYLDQAEKYGCRVLLAIGIKDVDRPAYAVPNWLSTEATTALSAALSARGRLTANLLLMLERVVAILADYDTIDAWQVEDEPLLPLNRGRGEPSIHTVLLTREIDVVREVDARHRPIVLTHSAGSVFDRRWRQALGLADIIADGLAAREAGTANAGLAGAVARWTIQGRLRLLALAAARQGKPLWLIVRQATPSLAKPRTDAPMPAGADPFLADDAGDSRLHEQLQAAIELVRRSGAARAYLQGAERWLLNLRQGQRREWDCARAVLSATTPAPR